MREEVKKLSNIFLSDDINDWLKEYRNISNKRAKERVRNLIVTSCMPLVRKIAHGLARRNTDPIEDIIQVGSIGLAKAIDSFDQEMGKSFKSYASYMITGEIRHFLRDKLTMIKAPREIQELSFRVNQIAIAMTQELGEKPSDEKLAEILQMPVVKVSEVFEMERRKQTVSLDQLVSFSDDDKVALSERISDDAYFHSEDFQETKILVKNALEKLPEDCRTVIELNFFEDMSQREISENLGVSQMQVSRRLHRGLKELFNLVRDNENA